MERFIEEIPSFFTIWNIIFLVKAMGVTFLLTRWGRLPWRHFENVMT